MNPGTAGCNWNYTTGKAYLSRHISLWGLGLFGGASFLTLPFLFYPRAPVYITSLCPPPPPGTKTAGWDQVVVELPGDITGNITGIRYAWGENPCCPSINRQMIPCPPASCPIQTHNTTLPAVPFWATIVGGKCSWISTEGGGK